jgi:3'-phosphoadenosine 5'-phosphosulfate sulfotransferase (PAPS reductase)/FAD synthetase
MTAELEVGDALDILAQAEQVRRTVQHLKAYIEEDIPSREVVGVVGLFSGGNDSTVLCHILRDDLTHLAHCNTGIGVEQTREFVRARAAEWQIPLIEVHPPAGSTYRELVIDQGFPGPGMHWKMYQRLKERGLRQVRGRLITEPRRQRVIFVAGRRRAESARRANVPVRETQGSIEWVSPLVDWTNEMMAAYRSYFELPRNEVSDMLHMSGECLCGAFARKGELDEIGFFFPGVRAQIEGLEAEVRAAGHAEPRCRWGWGANSKEQPSKSGPLCSTCDQRTLWDEGDAT